METTLTGIVMEMCVQWPETVLLQSTTVLELVPIQHQLMVGTTAQHTDLKPKLYTVQVSSAKHI